MLDPINTYEQLRKVIPLLGNSTKLEEIHKGYSSDRKYIVYDSSNHPQYLLRTYRIEEQDNEKVFNRLNMMEGQNVKCSKPIELGTVPELELGYMIISFVEGDAAAEVLLDATEAEQYNIGVEAGAELLKINQVPCPYDMKSWHERTIAKHNWYLDGYAKCGTVIPNDAELLSFIDHNLHLMQDRPNMFQHDDYHTGNLIVKDGKLSGVIDFHGDDWGDPIYEFVKIGLFSTEVSIPYSVGQIKGYHHRNDPDEQFWQLYSLYLAMTLFWSVVWVLKAKPEQLEDMMTRIQRVRDDHDNFELMVPKWYSQYQCEKKRGR